MCFDGNGISRGPMKFSPGRMKYGPALAHTGMRLRNDRCLPVVRGFFRGGVAAVAVESPELRAE